MYRELAETPDVVEYKKSVLEEIGDVVFPGTLHAGFGNKAGDALAYGNVGIDADHIVIAGHGAFRVGSKATVGGYDKIPAETIDAMFPPIPRRPKRGKE